ncbi:MAG: RluA family pseudouridine synthase [Firmicutes bacterium]|nr:RluA family pseudouridine synthase [Bacillota bacterium]
MIEENPNLIKVKKGGTRLDTYLKNHFGDKHTRSQITNSINNGHTTLNGQKVKNGKIVERGDMILAQIENFDTPAIAENIPLDIIYEDSHLLVINKPKGMIIHPGAGVHGGTLLNALLHYFEIPFVTEPDTNYPTPETNNISNQTVEHSKTLVRAGIVHRLDKNTSGLMIVAKTAQTQAKLSKMFETHEIKRTYVGLVEGSLQGQGTIKKNIIRDPNNRTRYKTDPTKGRHAITHYIALSHYRYGNRPLSLVQFNLETGRTHQIRVHMKSLNHPLVGDIEYNHSSTLKIEGQLLESVELSFIHPITTKQMEFKIQPQMQSIIAKLAKI